ncbi:IS3 family transposase [Mycoplasma sp. 2045]|uniref:IS3 family transposase n=1 Tax=Mycoplasma sp. 2045 TaxID=2967301 RepID=UPI00211C816B|nr:IS3 family transposase [Mycoplasma sp. 2045]UUM20641.1 IS3 family transposase [Mycoplasma sp. 2045]
MGRVGNSLDNREVEYFFSNIKSECLNFVNYKTICFDKLKNIIKDYIEWYNNERFQSVLNWKTPQQSWDALIFYKLSIRLVLVYQRYGRSLL